MTPLSDLVQQLIAPLNRAGVPYMVTGGVAAIVYGEPRLTNDVDVVLQMVPDDVDRFREAFPEGEYCFGSHRSST